MNSLTDKLVVVTGAGRGLGLAIAGAVADAGGRVVIAEHSAERAERGVTELRARGIRPHRIDTDVADPDSVARLAMEVARLGPLHGLVNNAALADGVGGRHFADIDVEAWDRLMTVNARGPWLVAKALYPQLVPTGGRIVNLASDVAHFGSPRLAHYVASKGAVIAMTRGMARDAGPDGVTVNAVAPGLTEVEATEGVPRERHALYADNRALKRPQQPSDITGAITFLLSDAAAYITGQTLVVDGGFVCA